MTDVVMLNAATVTLGACMILVLLCCLCCFCMRLSDLRMKKYILQMARRKGYVIDANLLEYNHKHARNRDPPETREVCTVMIPDVGIVF